MVKKIDELGRLVIPRELRDELCWPADAAIELCIEGDTLVARLSQEES